VVTAGLLCPLRLKVDFDRNPEYIAIIFTLFSLTFRTRDFLARFADDDIKITARDLPSFLYKSGAVYDKNDEVAGLFHGELLV
jgi:hypothetical protein